MWFRSLTLLFTKPTDADFSRESHYFMLGFLTMAHNNYSRPRCYFAAEGAAGLQAYRKARYEKNEKRPRKVYPVRDQKYRQAAYHKSKYREPIENKVARLESQGYKCANPVCLEPINLTTGHQDHNHETGEMRGILCHACNVALGLLEDSADAVRGLAAYRERFQ